jgi:hypothetical protein
MQAANAASSVARTAEHIIAPLALKCSSQTYFENGLLTKAFENKDLMRFAATPHYQ